MVSRVAESSVVPNVSNEALILDFIRPTNKFISECTTEYRY